MITLTLLLNAGHIYSPYLEIIIGRNLDLRGRKQQEIWQNCMVRSGIICLFVCFWRDRSQWARPSSFTRLIDHTQRRTIVGTTLLDEWSARSRDYLTTHNNHNRHPFTRWDS